MQKPQSDAHCTPPPICVGVCEAYSLQRVRFLIGLNEMVEPSSYPAATARDSCACHYVPLGLMSGRAMELCPVVVLAAEEQVSIINLFCICFHCATAASLADLKA
jgi:hypothetical protein